jgi:hypothetical protein
MKNVKKVVNKGAASEMLPSRMARTSLTKGDPLQRTMNNYAKKTPSGAGAFGAPSMMFMGSRPR